MHDSKVQTDLVHVILNLRKILFDTNFSHATASIVGFFCKH